MKLETNKIFLSFKLKSFEVEYGELKVSATISNLYSLYSPFNMEKNICKTAKILEKLNTPFQKLHLNLFKCQLAFNQEG